MSDIEEHKSQQTAYHMIASILKFSIPTWVNFVVGFASSYILTRAFLPEEYAIISLFITTTNLFMYLVCLGMDGAYIRFYYEPPNGEDRRLMLTKMLGLFTATLLALSFGTTIFFGGEFAGALFGIADRAITILLFVNIFSTVIMRFLNITYRMGMNARQYGIQNILMTSVIRLGALLAVPIDPAAKTAITAQTILLFILTLLYFFIQRKDVFPERIKQEKTQGFRRFISLRGYGELARFSLFSAPNYIVANANIFFAEQLIRNLLGASEMGIFVAVGYFSKLLEVMRGGFSTYWSAFMYANYETEQSRIIAVHDFVMMACSVMFFGLIAFKDIIYVLIGAEYRGSKTFFSLLLFGDILRLCSETTVYGINIKKRSDLSLANNVVMCAINLLLCWLLIPLWGLTGAAAAGASANLTYFVMASRMGQKYYKSIGSVRRTAACVTVMLVMALVPVWISGTIRQIPVLLFLMGVLGVLYRRQVREILVFARAYSVKADEREE